MTYAHVDDKARICLTREIVDKYGQEFMIVPARGEIILIPISKDPLKALQEEGKKIPNEINTKKLKEIAIKRAKRQIINKIANRGK